MPPRRFKKKSVRKIVEKRVAKAIEKYKKTRADSDNTGGSRSTNIGGTVVPEMHGCSYKTFMNGKPHSFKGTEGVVGLKHWFEKMEQVNVKAMMTTEYCPATEIQRMEQKLWTLTLKGDDIEAYSNRFHELVLMCPELVSTENKKIEKYIRGFPERIKGNITSSKPATLHETTKETPTTITITTTITTTTTATETTNITNNKTGGRKLPGPMLQPQPRVEVMLLGHEEKDCRVRFPDAGGNGLQNMTYFGCGEKGHYKNRCPKGRNPPNEGARARAYVVVENP
ncbi:putative reverse transcriptase domain-containing protein [Tanacetum coccineum]